MGVYIKNMKIPKTCDDCYIRERNTCPLLKTNVGGWGRCIGCPLVEVPSHVRLIDADDTENITIIMNENGSGFNRIIAPTIIDAEEDI